MKAERNWNKQTFDTGTYFFSFANDSGFSVNGGDMTLLPGNGVLMVNTQAVPSHHVRGIGSSATTLPDHKSNELSQRHGAHGRSDHQCHRIRSPQWGRYSIVVQAAKLCLPHLQFQAHGQTGSLFSESDKDYDITVPLERDHPAADLYTGQPDPMGFNRCGMACCTILRHGGRTAAASVPYRSGSRQSLPGRRD